MLCTMIHKYCICLEGCSAGSYRGKMAPGARNKFGTPMFEPKVFRKQMYCIEESTCDIVGSFRCPRIESAPRALCSPFPTSLRPWCSAKKT